MLCKVYEYKRGTGKELNRQRKTVYCDVPVSDIWTWNEAKRSKIRSVKTRYFRIASDSARTDRLDNDKDQSFATEKATGLNCEAVEWTEINEILWVCKNVKKL